MVRSSIIKAAHGDRQATPARSSERRRSIASTVDQASLLGGGFGRACLKLLKAGRPGCLIDSAG
jgi:hypothetical protein